jgi:hypothetical protein
MANIKVLWIDDEPSNRFRAFGHKNDLDITQALSVNKGKELLQTKKWDAIILDVNCKIDGSQNEVVSIEAFFEALQQMTDDIPYFVYTGGNYKGAEVLNLLHKKPYQDKKYFNKPNERDLLFDNIKEAVKDSPRYFARQKFADVCAFYQDDDLVDLLVKLDTDQIKTDIDVPTRVRYILSWVMKKLNSLCVLPIKANENVTNLAQCSRFLGYDKMQVIVPLHIQRNFHSSVSVANEGAHRNDEELSKVQTLLRNGDAPYLNSALIYELLSILRWSSTLDPKDNAVRRKNTIKILKTYIDKEGLKCTRIEGAYAIFANKDGNEKEIELAYI